MKIVINYESSWRDSVLTGTNDKPVDKSNQRKFKASSKSKEPADVREVTENTALGILSRLIGDQRKLYQAKQSEDFYFENINIHVKEVESKIEQWHETAFLINKSENRPPQSSFVGVLDENESLFFSDNSAILWSVLDLSFDELLNFINSPQVYQSNQTVSPKRILDRVLYDISSMEKISFIDNKIQNEQDKLHKEQSKENFSQKKIDNLQAKLSSLIEQSQDTELVAFETKVKSAVQYLNELFPDQSYYDKGGNIYPMSLYSGGLYVMIDEMVKTGMDTSDLVSQKGTIKGFSKGGFNGVRDFLNSLMGNKKKTTNTPYTLTKANGQLEITLDIDTPKAKELKKLMEDAGVSSFYLGKKGLAYVSDIRLR